MGVVTGNNLMIFTGRDMDVIGCEASCTLDVTETEVITTTKGTGRGTSREYGRYDATLTSNGVVFLYDTEDNSATGNKTDPTFMLGYMLKGKKVAAKFTISDGTTTKFIFANWVISNCQFAGNSGEHATYDITLKLDGELYPSADIAGDGEFDGVRALRYVHSGADANGFTDSLLIGATAYFIVRNGQVYSTIYTLAPIGPTEYVVFVTGTGTVNFVPDLTDGDEIFVFYDPA